MAIRCVHNEIVASLPDASMASGGREETPPPPPRHKSQSTSYPESILSLSLSLYDHIQRTIRLELVYTLKA